MNINFLSFHRLTALQSRLVRGLCAALLAPACFAGEVQLEWDPNSEPDLAGYRLYFGEQSGVYTEVIDVGNQTYYTLELTQDWDACHFAVTAYNLFGLESDPSNEAVYAPASLELAATVEGRWAFYNNSAWDDNDPAASALDDQAICPDKSALLPGRSASFSNYTSYSAGLNGIMIDISDLPATPSLEDFEFRVGNDNNPSGWSPAPAPLSVSARPGQGVGGSDRVTLLWNDNDLDGVLEANEAVAGAWLQVTVLASANTGLQSDDVFYFGNAIGEVGNNADEARVSTSDVLMIRDNTRTLLNPASIDDVYDINRDLKVNTQDVLFCRNHKTTFLNELLLINLGGGEIALSSFRPVPVEELRSTAGPFGVAMGRVEGLSVVSFPGPEGAEYEIYSSKRINGGWQLVSDPVREIAPGRFQLQHAGAEGPLCFYKIVPVVFEEDDVFPAF